MPGKAHHGRSPRFRNNRGVISYNVGVEQNPEVSVIIPCLDEAGNAAAYAETLLGPLTAALPSFELIFSDGGSADGTVDLLWRLAGGYPGVTALAGATVSGPRSKGRSRPRGAAT